MQFYHPPAVSPYCCVVGEPTAAMGSYPEATQFMRYESLEQLRDSSEFSVVLCADDCSASSALDEWPLQQLPVVGDLSMQPARGGPGVRLVAAGEATGCVVLRRAKLASAVGWEQFRRCEGHFARL